MKEILRIPLLIALLTVAVALGTTALVYGGSSLEAEAELVDPGNNASSPTGVEAEIEFEDDGSTLTISGEAEGLTPGIPYASLIYDVGSSAEGPDACEPTIFDPTDPNNILPTMFVGFWVVDEDGDGELEAINIVDDVTGGPVYVPLSKIGTMSIRDLTVPGPFGPGSGPAAVVACGEVEIDDGDDEEGTVTYEFSFDSTDFQFDFGNTATVRTGCFSYDGDNPVSFNNGQGFYVVDFNFAPTLSFDPQRDIGWVPQPTFDETTIETAKGELNVINDQWELFDSNGQLVFQISALPNGVGGFTGEIGENVPGGGSADVTFTLVDDDDCELDEGDDDDDD